MTLPSNDEIEALHQKYAPSEEVFSRVFMHCQIVWEIAAKSAAMKNLQINAELLRVGCLLHDLGAYPLFGEDGKVRPDRKYVMHGKEGEKLLKNEGFPEEIWRFATHHTGVGITKEDVVTQKLPMPVEDYLAETIEEALCMYADKFHSKTEPPVFNSFAWYKEYIAQFGSDKVARFEEMAANFGIPDLAPLVKKYHFAVR